MQKNINCSSGAMEMEGARIIFGRSIRLYTGLYTLKCWEMAMPKDTCQDHTRWSIQWHCRRKQIECVNHVTRRMGASLRTLVEKRKAQQLPIGGRSWEADRWPHKNTDKVLWQKPSKTAAETWRAWRKLCGPHSSTPSVQMRTPTTPDAPLAPHLGAFFSEHWQPRLNHLPTTSPCLSAWERSFCSHTLLRGQNGMRFGMYL